MYGKVAGKIVKRKNKTGYSYNFLIVKNQRSFMTGKSEYIVIHNFGTMRDSELKDKMKQLAFWQEVVKVLANLIEEGKIYQNCGSEIRGKFAEIVPIPIVKKIAPIENINPSIVERIRERYSLLAKRN